MLWIWLSFRQWNNVIHFSSVIKQQKKWKRSCKLRSCFFYHITICPICFQTMKARNAYKTIKNWCFRWKLSELYAVLAPFQKYLLVSQVSTKLKSKLLLNWLFAMNLYAFEDLWKVLSTFSCLVIFVSFCPYFL